MQPDSGASDRGISTSGLAPNLAAALSYLLGIITGVVFLMIEKNPYVRFHAWQSILLSVAWFGFWVAFTVLSAVLGLIPFLGFLVALIGILLSFVLGLGCLVLVIVLIVKAYQGEQYKLPFIGNMAEKYASGQ